jgi:hypothetical protein
VFVLELLGEFYYQYNKKTKTSMITQKAKTDFEILF